jgi:(2Fe-2S) ferredoxin
MDLIRSHVMVCGGTGCTSSDSPAIIKEFEKLIESNGLADEVKVVRTGCFGLCAAGPVVIVYPEGAFYSRVKVSDVKTIVEEHLIKGRIVKDLLYHHDQLKKREQAAQSLNDVEFYKKQKRVALRNCGVIDPENIDEYIAFDGYKALEKVLTTMKPQDVIDVISKSVCAAAAVRVSPPVPNGSLQPLRFRIRNMFAATLTKAIRARLWIGPCWKAIRMWCWRQWPLPVMPSVRIRATSIAAQSIPLRLSVWKLPSSRPASTAFWARIFSAPALILILKCALAQARLSAARKPH